jgi:leukotriene-A4 hydrolase
VAETQSIDVEWRVEFSTKRIIGAVELHMNWKSSDKSHRLVRLDSRALTVLAAQVDGREASFELLPSNEHLGTPLVVRLPDDVPTPAVNQRVTLRIAYHTAPDAAAIQWLASEQTAGKKHPYLFTQCQAIHARSLLPCQDTPAIKVSYKAAVTVPAELTALMSALAIGEPSTDAAAGTRTFRFEQPRPIPTYLFALAVGDLAPRTIGPRSAVWSEPSVVDSAAFEFSETEAYVQAGEALFGPYVWGRYDQLMMPPSYPYGGMENACMAFMTPTLIAGDKSLADVVAHEIGHCWFGNFVGTKGWEHFWLNEGFTVFAERAIIGHVHGAARRDFSAHLGRKALRRSVELFGEQHEFTKLVPNIDGIDPDDAFSSIPYEKGFTLLDFLASVVGRGEFAEFLKQYVARFGGKTLTSDEFKAFFLDKFAAKSAVIAAKVDWNAWFHQPGMPPVLPTLDLSLSAAVTELAAAWHAFDAKGGAEPAANAGKDFIAGQVMLFLDELIDHAPLKHATLAKIDAAFALGASGNTEIRFRFYMLGLASDYEPVIDGAINLATTQGRMKFTRPLYRELAKKHRERAVSTFKTHWRTYHPICSKMVTKDLGLNATELN